MSKKFEQARAAGRHCVAVKRWARWQAEQRYGGDGLIVRESDRESIAQGRALADRAAEALRDWKRAARGRKQRAQRAQFASNEAPPWRR
jgi:hypothetical protein